MSRQNQDNRQNNRKYNAPGRQEGIPDGLFAQLDEQGAYQFISSSVAEILGCEAQTVIGRAACDLVHPEDQKEFSRYLTGAEEKRAPDASFRFRHTKGHYIRLHLAEWSARENGLISKFVLRRKHFAGRRCTKALLKAPEKRLADMIDFLPDATLAINLRSEVIAWNRAMEEMTGIKAVYMLGRKNYDYVVPFCGYRRPILIDYVLHPDPDGEIKLSVTREKNDLLINELFVPYMKDNGAYLWCKASPLYDGRGNLMGAIESIRDITELKRREADLHIKAVELNDLNTTLKVLLQQRDRDRSELEDRILSNIKLLIEPYLERLKHHADATGKSYLELIQSNLEEITSPFTRKLSVHYINLTNTEIQVASLIREGKTTKEITEIINISESAVNVYRHHIRRKLGLTKKQNLNAYLLALPKN